MPEKSRNFPQEQLSLILERLFVLPSRQSKRKQASKSSKQEASLRSSLQSKADIRTPPEWTRHMTR